MADLFPDIDTPAVLIDEAVALRNIATFQKHCDSHGIRFRPHIKTHKTSHFAKAQIQAGACGINCQKVSEANALLEKGGIDDILITFNILGESKLAALRTLAQRVRLSVVADSETCVDGLANAFRDSPEPLTVLVECDTGAGRCGVITPQQARDLAKHIVSQPGLRFGGLMTYPDVGGAVKVQQFMSDAKALIESDGTPVPVISSGGSPDMWDAQHANVVTEYRAGTYIYNDRSLVERGTCTEQDCALSVLATVVSTPAPDRAVIDAGSKVLTSDLLGLDGHGLVVGHPELSVAQLSEEHGHIKSSGETGLKVGDRLQIIPNHACVVSNMLDKVVLTRDGASIQTLPVDARGCVW